MPVYPLVGSGNNGECNMIRLYVETPTGHYRIPGQVGQGEVASTFPVPPPATIKGFLESLTGSTRGSFQGEFAYGRARLPAGYGMIYQRVHVWASGGIKAKGSLPQQTRTCHVETLIDPAYVILVRGSWEAKVQSALRGDVERYGVLYLGRSADFVTWLDEFKGDLDPIEWIVPGKEIRLITRSGRGYDHINPDYGTFSLRPGEPHWFKIGTASPTPTGMPLDDFFGI